MVSHHKGKCIPFKPATTNEAVTYTMMQYDAY